MTTDIFDLTERIATLLDATTGASQLFEDLTRLEQESGRPLAGLRKLAMWLADEEVPEQYREVSRQERYMEEAISLLETMAKGLAEDALYKRIDNLRCKIRNSRRRSDNSSYLPERRVVRAMLQIFSRLSGASRSAGAISNDARRLVDHFYAQQSQKLGGKVASTRPDLDAEVMQQLLSAISFDDALDYIAWYVAQPKYYSVKFVPYYIAKFRDAQAQVLSKYVDAILGHLKSADQRATYTNQTLKLRDGRISTPLPRPYVDEICNACQSGGFHRLPETVRESVLARPELTMVDGRVVPSGACYCRSKNCAICTPGAEIANT